MPYLMICFYILDRLIATYLP